MLIAQITDTHIRRKGTLLHHVPQPARSLRRALAEIEALVPRPDLVVATGDLVECGAPKEYRRLRKILAGSSIPLVVVAGNHDARGALREAFADHRYLPARGPLCYAIDSLPLRLVGLDTTRAGEPGGELDDARLCWFERTLAREPTRPTFVFMHHPPFRIGVPLVDVLGFRGEGSFAAIVARNPQIVRIACGHVHRHAAATIGTTLATTAPSTATQLVVVRSGALYSLRVEAPGYALHRWNGRAMTTTIRRVDAVLPPRVDEFIRERSA